MAKDKTTADAASKKGVPHHQVHAVTVCERCQQVVSASGCQRADCKGAGKVTRQQCSACESVLSYNENAATHECGTAKG